MAEHSEAEGLRESCLHATWYKPLRMPLVFFFITPVFLLKVQQWTGLFRYFGHNLFCSAPSLTFSCRLPTLPPILPFPFLVQVYKGLTADGDFLGGQPFTCFLGEIPKYLELSRCSTSRKGSGSGNRDLRKWVDNSR